MKLLATGKACVRTLTAAMVFATLLSAPPTFAQTASSKATAAISTAVGCIVDGTSNIDDTLPTTYLVARG
jgi:hypothetical protein